MRQIAGRTAGVAHQGGQFGIDPATLQAEAARLANRAFELGELPLFRGYEDIDVLNVLASRFVQKEFKPGDVLTLGQAFGEMTLPQRAEGAWPPATACRSTRPISGRCARPSSTCPRRTGTLSDPPGPPAREVAPFPLAFYFQA